LLPSQQQAGKVISVSTMKKNKNRKATNGKSGIKNVYARNNIK